MRWELMVSCLNLQLSKIEDFVFETAPSADNCIVGPDYPAEACF
jgi:hypothetical protein